MSAKYLPHIGDPYLGDNPSPVMVQKVTFGFDSDNPAGSDYGVDVACSDLAATGNQTILWIPDGTMILDVIANIRTVFAGTGEHTLSLGVASAASEIFADTGMISSDAGLKERTGTTGGVHAAPLVYYVTDIGATSDLDTDNNIAVVAGVATTALAAGFGEFYFYYTLLPGKH